MAIGAIFNSLIYGGVDSADYGVYITGDAVFNAPKRSVELVSVPGRNGAIEIDQGHFENIEVSYPAGMFGDDQTDFRERLSDFRNAIMSQKGYQRLWDTYHPDEFRMGIYVDGLEVEPKHYNEAGQFTLKFNCKPQRWLTSGEEPIDVMEWGETETVSGDIVTFEADETTGIKSALVEFSARQDGTPWISGLEQTPYLLRQSPQLGNSYNSEMDTLIGGTIAWNQLVKNDANTETKAGITYTKNSDGSWTCTGTYSERSYKYLSEDFIADVVASRDVIYVSTGNTMPNGTRLDIDFRSSSSYLGYMEVVGGESYKIRKALSGSTVLGKPYIDINNYTVGATVDFTVKPMVVNLTRIFGTEIADYVYGLEQSTAGSGIAWLKSYGFLTKDYYAYDAGSLVSVKTSEHRTTGKNLAPITFNGIKSLNTVGTWSGNEYTLNDITFTVDANVDGNVNKVIVNGTASSARSLNLATYTLLAGRYTLTGCPTGGSDNTYYLDWRDDNGGQRIDRGNGDVYETNGQSGYLTRIVLEPGATANNLEFKPMIRYSSADATYEPYESHSYPLDPNLELRGLFKLDANNNLYADGDVYESSGAVSRKYGIVDLGTLNWLKNPSSRIDQRYYTVIPDANPSTQNAIIPNYQWELYASESDKKWWISASKALYMTNTNCADAQAFKTAMSGVYLVYELATPTTETADSFASPQIVDPNGSEEYVDERSVPVPVGHRTSYADAYSINGWDEVNVYVSPTQDEEDAEVHTFEFGLTYYGGDVNYISGKVKENKVRIVAHEIKNHYYDFTPATHIYDVRLTGSFNGKISSGSTVPNPTNALCNIMDISASGAEMDLFDGSSVRAGMYHDSSFNYTRLRIVMPQNITTKAEAEAWLDSSNIEIVYDRYEPVEDQHISESFLPIQGQNYIWADSGDVTIEYGMMPGYIINPTRFDVRPLLMVEGDGALEVNGYDVFLRNSVLGRVVIEPAGSITKPSFYTYRSQVSHVFQNKPISFEVGDIISYGKVTYSARIITTILGNVNSVTFTPLDNFVGTVAAINYMGLTPMGYHRYEVHVDVAYQYDIGEIASGSSESGSVQAQYEISYSASGLATETLTFKYEGFPGEDDAQNLKLEMKVEGSGGAYNGDINTITWSYGDFVAESTKPTLGHPAYIDCELGEAYMIESGEVISLNSAVDLGSDLPTLSPGVNKITRSFTITGLEIEPRWWKV